MNEFQRQVRASVMASFRDTSQPPSVATLAAALGAAESAISSALDSLAAEHCLVQLPGTNSIWMAHPFSGVATDFLVTIGSRRWFANCVWDGLSILALFGDGRVDTHSPATGEPIGFEVTGGIVNGEALVHFPVPPRRFWDDIGFT